MKQLTKCMAALLGLVAFLSTELSAQPAFPSRPVVLIVPFAAGGPADAVARTLAPPLAQTLGGPVRVENRPGASGVAGTGSVAKSAPDGHTLLLGDPRTISLPAAVGARLPYRPDRDFVPVSEVARATNVLVVNGTSTVDSVRGLLELAKRRPGQVTFAFVPGATPSELAGKAFRRMAGIAIREIPYPQSQSLLAAIAGGEVTFGFESVAVAGPLIRSGRVKALAVTSPQRSPLYPNLSTVAEAGLPGYATDTYYGVFAPAGTPQPIVARLARGVMSAVETATVRKRLAEMGLEPVGGSPERFATKLRAEVERWAPIAREERIDIAGSGTASAPVLRPPLPPGFSPPPPDAIGGGAPPPAPKPVPPPAAAPAPAPAPRAPPAPPVPPTGPIAAATDPLADASRVYWNRWFQNEARVIDELEVGERYEFVLDLSRYRYRDKQSSRAEPALESVVATAKSTGASHITLRIRSIFLGGVLSRVGETEKEMRIPLAKLEAPTDANARAREARTWNDYRNGRLSIPEAAPTLQAVQISIPVRAERRGCAQIAIAVFDKTGIRPLDHVVETVPVREAGGPSPDCRVEESDARSRAGLSTLLLFSGSSGQAEQADASLSVFETAVPGTVSKKRSVAVFVDAKRYTSSLAEKDPTDRGVYGWEVESSLGGFVSDPAHLLTLIKGGRKQGTYGTVAQIMSDKIFSTPNEGAEEEQPKKALAALQRLARESKKPPVVLARIVSADDELVLLPLSLLAARGPKPVLANPILVVHPLSRQHYVSSRVCVDTWNFGIPTSLEGIPGTVTVDTQPAPWISRWIRSLKDLREFLSTPASVDATTSREATNRAEGFVLLAHHAKGNLWFEDSANPVITENIKREFPSGTVALLSACSVGDPAGDNSAILRKLNAKGIDAMIVSPFPVHAGYGTELAKQFANTVRSARNKKENRTLAELFRDAASQAATSANSLPPAQKGDADFSDMHLEFVIAGDQEIRLCNN